MYFGDSIEKFWKNDSYNRLNICLCNNNFGHYYLSISVDILTDWSSYLLNLKLIIVKDGQLKEVKLLERSSGILPCKRNNLAREN